LVGEKWSIKNVFVGGGVFLDKSLWLKELIDYEVQREQSGIIGQAFGQELDNQVAESTLEFIGELKQEFQDAIDIFNDLSNTNMSKVKLYTIAKTHGDFMLFRNGFKLIFAIKQPGQISIRLNFMATQSQSAIAAKEKTIAAEDIVEIKQGVYGELYWTFKSQRINMQYLIRHYMTRFINESLKI
jgi:hypothetical protein